MMDEESWDKLFGFSEKKFLKLLKSPELALQGELLFELLRQLSLFKKMGYPLSPLESFDAQKAAIVRAEKTVGPITNAYKTNEEFLSYIFTPNKYLSPTFVAAEYTSLDVSTIIISIHSMQVAAAASFCKLAFILKNIFPLNVISPGSSSPDLINDALTDNAPHFIIIPDVSINNQSQEVRDSYKHCLVVWEEPHVIVERNLGRKNTLIVTGEGTTGDFIRTKRLKKIAYEFEPVPSQKTRLFKDSNEQISLILPVNKVKSIRNIHGMTLSREPMPKMSFSLYAHKSIYPNELFMKEFLQLYVSVFNSTRNLVGHGSIWQLINIIRNLNKTPGLLNNFRLGKFKT